MEVINNAGSFMHLIDTYSGLVTLEKIGPCPNPPLPLNVIGRKIVSLQMSLKVQDEDILDLGWVLNPVTGVPIRRRRIEKRRDSGEKAM